MTGREQQLVEGLRAYADRSMAVTQGEILDRAHLRSRRSRRRSRLLLAAACCVLVVGLAGVAVKVPSTRDDGTTPSASVAPTSSPPSAPDDSSEACGATVGQASDPETEVPPDQPNPDMAWLLDDPGQSALEELRAALRPDAAFQAFAVDYESREVVVLTEPDSTLTPASGEAISQAQRVFGVRTAEACRNTAELETMRDELVAAASNSSLAGAVTISIDWASSEVVLRGDRAAAEEIVGAAGIHDGYRIDEEAISRLS